MYIYGYINICVCASKLNNLFNFFIKNLFLFLVLQPVLHYLSIVYFSGRTSLQPRENVKKQKQLSEATVNQIMISNPFVKKGKRPIIESLSQNMKIN